MKCLLGIDAGTSGIKAVVIDTAGNILGSGYCECDIQTPRPSWVEQNPMDWWKACDAAVKKAVKHSGCGKDVVGIGFSGQMQGSTLLDRNGRPMDSCIIWMDQRAHKEADELNTRLSAEEILNTTASYCLPSYWAAKLLWLQRNQPEVYEKISKVLFPKDFLRYMMTGEIATEVSDASCSWFLDLKNRKWSDKMFEVTGIDKDIIPQRLVESQEVTGYLLPQVAEEWGLPAGIPVVAGAGDQEAGGIGMGVIKPGCISSTIGTSGVVFGCSDVPFIDPEPHGMYSQCHGVPGMYSFLGVTLGAGGSFKWMRNTLFGEKKVELEKQGKDIYDYMTSLAEKAAVGCEGVAFLPYLSGEGTPHVDPDARGVFFGLSYRSSLNEMCRAVMEGVTFSLRDSLEICRATGLSVSEVRASGGGAKSALWRQIQADVYNADVLTMNVDEAPAAGAAILAGVGAGCFKNIEEGCEAIVKISGVTHPIQENVKRYDDYYQTYRRLYRSLKEDFAYQASIVEKYL